MGVDRQKKVLAILLILFLIVLGYRIMNPFRQGRVANLTYRGAADAESTLLPGAKAPADTKGGMGVEVHLELLQNPPEHRGAVLNEYFFRTIPAVKSAAPFSSAAQKAETAETGSASEDPLQVVEQDLGRLQVIGIYTRGGEPVVFFQRGKQTLVVRKGDRIDGKYLVEGITLDTITLRAEHIDDTVHIDLTQFLKSYERDRLKSK